MPVKDLHNEPFDETTIVKLKIFEEYAQAWIPTFVMSKEPVIYIFDFFAGTGYDINGVAGSPIRILNKIKEQVGNIFQKKTSVTVFFNEWQPDRKEQAKFANLKEACEEFLSENKEVERAIKIQYYNENFETLFPKLLPEIKAHASLVYLDQNGVKFISDPYFLPLTQTTKTDFLYFMASSFIGRFGDSDEFREYLQIDRETAKKDPYKFIHRNVLSQLRDKLPQGSKTKLYPFTLKKGANIYGIIFGASHPRAVDKFLALAWKINPVNGYANFDIDNEKCNSQLDLFNATPPTKIESFQKSLREKVLFGELDTNKAVLDFTYSEGHIPSHAAETLRSMKKKSEISYEGTSPLITYENVYQLNRILNYGKI
jgi:three-Cys-motif partner protein